MAAAASARGGAVTNVAVQDVPAVAEGVTVADAARATLDTSPA